MSFPNFPDKHRGTPLITPRHAMDDLRAHGRLEGFQAPRGVLLLYRPVFFQRLVERHAAEPDALSWYGSQLYRLPRTGGRVGMLGNFGIGGPVVAMLVEELGALGVRAFVSLGLSGGLQVESTIGEIVVGTRAIRDEGVSYHYAPPDKYALPSERLTQALAARLRARGVPFLEGTTWTIDTPYRETVEEVRQYRAEGVLTVEMEAAALFTVAAHRGLAAAAGFVVSDLLGETEWTADFGAERLDEQLEVLVDAATEAILEAA